MRVLRSFAAGLALPRFAVAERWGNRSRSAGRLARQQNRLDDIDASAKSGAAGGSDRERRRRHSRLPVCAELRPEWKEGWWNLVHCNTAPTGSPRPNPRFKTSSSLLPGWELRGVSLGSRSSRQMTLPFPDPFGESAVPWHRTTTKSNASPPIILDCCWSARAV